MNILKQIPIPRSTYFLNWFVANVIVAISYLPGAAAVLWIPGLDDYAIGIVHLTSMFLGGLLYCMIFVNSVLNRARDIEGKKDVSIPKWIFLSMFPFVAIYGQCLLLFKKGKS